MKQTTLAYQRLINQHIEGPKFTTPEEVVRWMGAMQAQDYGQAVWAIGSRTDSATLKDVEQAIADRKILRTWPMRGTIHFVPAKDAKWMLQLSAARMIAADARRLRQLELDESIIEQCGRLFYTAMQDGKPLPRPIMMQLLEDAGIGTKNQRGYHILWHLAQTGLICLGPLEGKKQTFVLLDKWVPDSTELSREEALAELAKRYFTSHGPATLYDFAWWSGLTITDARAGLQAATPRLIGEKIDATEYWLASESQVPRATDIALLPGFDEYLLGYKDRSAVLAVEHSLYIVPGNNGVFLPFIVLDGQVVGLWKRTIKKQAVIIKLLPFVAFSKAVERQCIEMAKRYAEFLGLQLVIE